MRGALIELPADVRDLSPTARLVYVVLDVVGHALARDELLAQTAASTDALLEALDALEERGLVEREPHPTDGRGSQWNLVEGDP